MSREAIEALEWARETIMALSMLDPAVEMPVVKKIDRALSLLRAGQVEGWQPIETFNEADREAVDLWLQIHASPRSMGMSDVFRVSDAFRIDGKWFHYDSGKQKELYADYITHWRAAPPPPQERLKHVYLYPPEEEIDT